GYNGDVLKLSIDKCPKEPCTVMRTERLTVTMEFVSTSNAESVIGWQAIWIYPIFAKRKWTKLSNVCANMKPTCPLKSGITYQIKMDVTAPFGKYNDPIEVALYDEDNNALACA
ncbi:hypothetical protein X801_06435, partial [Opisthorchis viverrini]